jgi:hypothetical protein
MSAKFSWVIFLALSLTLVGCRTPSSDWNGTWKLNTSKSSFQGPVFTITISPSGEYHYDDGNSDVSIVCDGKDRPLRPGVTRSCAKRSPSTLDIIRKENGVETSESRWELSDDGSVFTVTATEIRPTGPVVTNQTVSSRVSGSGDFAGQWRQTSYLQKHDVLTLSLNGEVLKIAYPNAGQYVDAPLDGADTPVRGPHAPDGTSYSVRVAGGREFLVVIKRNGKILTQGSLQLSGDGGAVTDSWGDPQGAAAEGSLVYERESK